jgi:hypothetical protein
MKTKYFILLLLLNLFIYFFAFINKKIQLEKYFFAIFRLSSKKKWKTL